MPEAKMTMQHETEPRKSDALTDCLFGLTRSELHAIEVLGFQLYEQGRTVEAQTIFQGLIALDRRMYQGYAGMGALALAEQNLEQAADWLTQAVERNANDPTVQANLGETLLRLGRFEPAAAAFEKALQLDPEQKDPGANRARAIVSGMKLIIQELQKSDTEMHEQNAEAKQLGPLQSDK
jgi:tetratricopeptide (TPR) repeat protein